jgi:hypothetical protein
VAIDAVAAVSGTAIGAVATGAGVVGLTEQAALETNQITHVDRIHMLRQWRPRPKTFRRS